MLFFSNPYLHGKCVNMIRNLMTCHDCDPRYADPECRARVAALYLPLLGIVMDSLGQLHTGPHDNSKGNFQRPQRMQYIDYCLCLVQILSRLSTRNLKISWI